MSRDLAGFYLRNAQRVTVTPGASGYFSAPRTDYDPNLFTGTRIRPEIRAFVLTTLYGFLAQYYQRPQSWSRVWLAGSGVSYQWAAGRGNGDLDCLFGVDWVRFRQNNPGHVGHGDRECADEINTLLRDVLWPRTALTRFGSQSYELTFFVNVNTGLDIRSIRPYAAYDLTSDTWSVRPPKLPHDPETLYPPAWRTAALHEAQMAHEIVGRYNTALQSLHATKPGTGPWTNAHAAANLASAQAAALYEDIHTGRRSAFGPSGRGYSDWANYRWQSAKRSGIAAALHSIAKIRAHAGDHP